MHVAILAPSHRSFISKFIRNYNIDDLPEGQATAPIIGIIISGLLEHNHKVTAITTSRSIGINDTVKSFSCGNFTWIVVPLRHHSFRFNGKRTGYMLDFFSVEQNSMLNCIKDIKPDVIHAHWSYEYAGVAIKSNLPCLVTIHDNAIQILLYFKNLYRLGRLLMSEYNLRLVKYASTVSPYMKDYSEKRCGTVRIIPNPVDINLLISDIEIITLFKSKSLIIPKLIMINNGWDSRKNGLNALIAFKQVLKHFPDATLDIYGSNSETGGLAYQDGTKLNIRNVNYHGSISHEQLLSAIDKSHLLIHPSLEESFGVVLIEAMSRGVPVIGGIKSGAVPWVIDNKELLIDVRMPDQIANKIIDLLSAPNIYRQLAIQSYKNVLYRFSSKIVVEKYLRYYNDIIKYWK